MMTRRTFLAAATVLSIPVWPRQHGVTIGVCSRDAASAARYGFDYIEPSAADIDAMTDAEFAQFSAAVSASKLRCRAFNSLIRRPDLNVVGEDVPRDALAEYLTECLDRCRLLGAAIVVWGSAGSRNVPNGFCRDRARSQIVDFLRLAGDIARPNNIDIAIEPLRRQESNILNTGAEAYEMVRAVRNRNVKMIIDYFHMREEGEDPRIIETARREIVHFHFANPNGRRWPRDLAEDAHYGEFFRYVKKIDYAGGISIEGRGSFDADATASLTFFRQSLSDAARRPNQTGPA